jgi:hypothetical protein
MAGREREEDERMRIPELILDRTRPTPGEEPGCWHSLIRLAALGGALLGTAMRLLRIFRAGSGL